MGGEEASQKGRGSGQVGEGYGAQGLVHCSKQACNLLAVISTASCYDPATCQHQAAHRQHLLA